MRKILPLIAASLLIGGAAEAKRPDPQERLDRALAGRVAGEPVSCIDLHRVTSSQVIDGTAILYRVGSTIYVNRPDNGADSLDDRDTMVTRTFSTQLCDVDTVTMVEPVSRTFRGIVFLGEFVPYRRVQTGSAR